MLELLLPHIDSREMHVQLSTVSQHMQQAMQTHIRQHVAAFLKQYLNYHDWMMTGIKQREKKRSAGRRSECETADWVQSVRWLCKVAGREAMGTAAAAMAVLTTKHCLALKLYRDDTSSADVAHVLIQSGVWRGCCWVPGVVFLFSYLKMTL